MLIPLLLLLQLIAPPVGVEVYRSEKGLNANALYGVLVDPNGFVWVHTDNGLYRYDGNTFKVVPSTLGREVVLANFVDSTTIAALSFDNSIDLIDIRRLSASQILSIPDSIKLNSFASTVHRFGDTLYVGTSENRILINVENRWSSLILPKGHSSFFHNARVAMIGRASGRLAAATTAGTWFIGDIGFQPDNIYAYIAGKPAYSMDHWWVPGRYDLFQLTENGFKSTRSFASIGVKGFIHQAVWRNSSELWLATKEEGLLVFNFYESGFTKSTLLDVNEISGLSMDEDGTIWVSTLRNGLYKYRSWFDRFTTKDRVNGVPLGRTMFTSDELIVTEFNGAFIKRKSGSYSGLLSGAIHFADNMQGDKVVIGQIDDAYVVGGSGGLTNIEEIVSQNGTKIQHPIKASHRLGGDIALSTPNGVYILDERDLKLQRFYPDRSTAVVILDENRIAIGRPNRLDIVDRSDGSVLITKPYRVTFLSKLNNQQLLVGTNGDGLIAYNIQANSAITTLSGSWNSIHRLNAATYAIVGAPGLFIVQLDSLAMRVGLNEIPLTPSGFAQQVMHVRLSSDEHLWFSTTAGVLKMPFDDAMTPLPIPRLKISDLVLNGLDHSVSDTVDVSRETERVSISLSIQGEFNPNIQVLEYLRGDNASTWIPLSQPSIEIESIRKGLTTFQFRLRNVLTDEVVSSVSIVVRKQPYWWELPWVIGGGVLLVVLATIGLTTLVQRRYLRRKMDALAAEDRVRELERVAVTRLLSSHYLFNALATIRSVARRSTDEVNWYIGRLSKLIRALIDRTSQREVDLQSELDWIRDYVALESVGRQLNIEFTVTIDDDLDADEVYLPAFILQPVVENAMFHGALKDDPVIQCDIRKVDDRLHIFIRNRIAKESLPADSPATSSRGLLFMTERLKGWGRYHGFQLDADDVLSIRLSATEWSTEIKLPLINHNLPLVNRN